jgi:hypothetical protein
VTWLLIEVLAGISCASAGLHCVLGIHHGADQAIGVCQPAAVSGLQVANGDDGVCDEANCPICNYLAQAKVAGEYFAIAVCSAGVSNDDIPPQVAVPAADLRPFEARGPPAA